MFLATEKTLDPKICETPFYRLDRGEKVRFNWRGRRDEFTFIAGKRGRAISVS